MRKDFKSAEKVERLIWCDRHCCLCEKKCGLDIELAHIDRNDDNRIENAIPVCYDCHAKMGMYNALHPRGTKLKPAEIRALRDQVYERYTSKYVAPIHYVITQELEPLSGRPPADPSRQFPDVSLSVLNLSEHLGARLLVELVGYLNGRRTSLMLPDPLYTGRKRWNLNPRRVMHGHFQIRNRRLVNLRTNDRFEVRMRMVQGDPVGRDHVLLEDGYVYNQKTGYWYFEP
jgi:hypothetical protein